MKLLLAGIISNIFLTNPKGTYHGNLNSVENIAGPGGKA